MLGGEHCLFTLNELQKTFVGCRRINGLQVERPQITLVCQHVTRVDVLVSRHLLDARGEILFNMLVPLLRYGFGLWVQPTSRLFVFIRIPKKEATPMCERSNMVVEQPRVSFEKIILYISFICVYRYSCVSTLMVALKIDIFPVELKV